ncbi:hypothetical protein [Fibrobacter sp. UBA4297]|uniref:hypothetical protein n=1 Tax=Fibrobacter sp. UBA4297 TaxID=1946536 RepID=UPI0025C6E9F2|nr:hypothetical protein [Fibrobacter sp. UBA4297]
MNKKTIKFGLAVSAMALYFAGCGDDLLYSQDVNQFTTVSSLKPEDCSDSTEGSMAFVKSKATMYVCSEGEWVAMNDHEAIQYRCESKELKDKSGIAIICDGNDTIGVVYNGKNGSDGSSGANGSSGTNGKSAYEIAKDNGFKGSEQEWLASLKGEAGKNGSNGSNGSNGVSVDTAAIKKSINDALSAASAKSEKDINAKLSSASAKNQKDIDDALANLSSASAKNQKDVDDALKNLSSATDKFGEDIDSKFNDAYSSLSAELEDKKCEIVNTERNDEKAIITVTIKCGDAETKMEIPFTVVNENLAKVYKKHVVVRFPVQANKETRSRNIYEEIWKELRGGDNTELTVTDLDEKFAPSGKVFMQDLFASANKSFVTIEETNEKMVEYKIARLEGDLDITNLTTPIVKLRVKLSLTPSVFAKLGIGIIGPHGLVTEPTTDVIFNAYADLSDASDTIVIDFLTDYKAARVKKLVDDGNGFGVANEQANKELAHALYLENSEEYPSFEHFVPDQIGLAENFNSIAWVIALIQQKDKTPGFNSVYNAFRNVFAENGNFNTAVNTTYAGKEHSMFFVDYLALLIDAAFNLRVAYETGIDGWFGSDAVYYKILQNGFVEAYKLKVEDAKVFNDPDGYSSKVYKSDVKGGYFRYFEYIENEQVWYPVIWAAGAATAEKDCDENAVNSTFFYSFDGLDDNAVCVCDNGNCGWQYTENVCLGRNKGDKGAWFVDGKIQEYECECDLSASSTCDDLVPGIPNSSNSVASSSSAASGKTPEEQANNPESKLYLGVCNVDNEGKEKLFDIRNAELATTTSKTTFVCDGSKWRQKDYHDEKYGICSKTTMEKGEVKEENGSEHYKCDYLDKQEKYEWIAADWQDVYNEKACHYGYVNKKMVTGSGYEYVCEENSEYTDNDGNHTHEWRETTVDEFCVGDRVEATVQKLEDEDLGESTFNEKCSYHGSTYARNNTASGAKEWVYYGNFTNESTRNSVLLLLNGYKDNIIYACNDWVNIYCEPVSVETVQSKIASNMPEVEKQKWINVLCNYGDYKRASGYADGIAFEVNVTLKSGENPKTFVASAKRDDWHEPTFEDIYGKCDKDKMENQTKVAVYGGEKYKCNYISGGPSSGYYSWVKASDLDENATLGICTRNRKKDAAVVGDVYYECLSNGNAEGIPASSSSTDWLKINENEYLNAKFGYCDTDRGDTKNIADIKSETLKDGESHSFKCSIAKDVVNDYGKWVDASTDIVLDKICNRDNEDATVTKESVIYVCAYKDESSMYQWITSDEYCETHGENLTYGGYLDNPYSSSSMSHCGRRIECQTETDKKICHVGTESFVNLDTVWQSVAVYCDKHSTGSACEFVNHEGEDITMSTLKYYEQTEYYVKTEQGYKKAETAEEYCDAFSQDHKGLCVFDFGIYTYYESSREWDLTLLY